MYFWDDNTQTRFVLRYVLVLYVLVSDHYFVFLISILCVSLTKVKLFTLPSKVVLITSKDFSRTSLYLIQLVPVLACLFVFFIYITRYGLNISNKLILRQNNSGFIEFNSRYFIYSPTQILLRAFLDHTRIIYEIPPRPFSDPFVSFSYNFCFNSLV